MPVRTNQPRATATRGVSLRMTDSEYQRLIDYAERHDVNLSQALRELLELGAAASAGRDVGTVYSDRAIALLADSVGVARVQTVAGVNEEGISQLRKHAALSPSAAKLLRAGGALVCVPEDFGE